MDDLFNRKLTEFVDELVDIYPTIHDFRVFQTTLYAACVFDKSSPRQYFKTYVIDPFEKKILARDEDFFIQKEEYVDSDLNIVARLKTVWASMPSKNKDAIWRYMQVLVYLGKQSQRA